MRKKKNRIQNLLKYDGALIDDIGEMQNLATAFYRDLYTSEGTLNMQEVIDRVPRKVTTPMNESLTACYMDMEIKNALFQMFPSKAPGPNGFLAHFYQCNWEICSADVCMAVHRILTGEESAESINNTVLVLIPKIQNPNHLSQF